MGPRISELALLLVLVAAVPAGADEGPDRGWLDRRNFDARYETRQYAEWVNGSEDQSPRAEGTWHNEELTLDYQGGREGITVTSSLQARVTDDPRTDDRAARLERWYLTAAAAEAWQTTVGDAYVNYTPYTLGRALEGIDNTVRWRWAPLGLIEFRNDYGRLAPRRTGAAFERRLGGARFGVSEISRFATPFCRQLRFGYSYARAADDPHSLNDRTGISEVRGITHGLDAAWRSGYEIDWTLEYARSRYYANRLASLTAQEDDALKLAAAKRFELWSSTLNADWEQVGPYFTTVTGSASPDQRRWSLRGSARPRGGLTLRGGRGSNRDNLAGQLAATTEISNSELNAELEPLPEQFPGLILTGSWRDRDLQGSNGTADRLRRGFEYGVSAVAWGWNGALNYTDEKNNDYLTTVNSSRTVGWNFDLSRSFQTRDWHFRPRVSASRSRDRYLNTGYGTKMTSTRAALDAEWRDWLTAGISWSRQANRANDGTQDGSRDVWELELASDRYAEEWASGNLTWRSTRNRDRVGTQNYREDRLEFRADRRF